MKKILDFVSSTNQILLFLAALLFIFVIGKELTSGLFKPSYGAPKVKIIDKLDDRQRNTQVEYKTSFNREILDVFVFNVDSDAIKIKSEQEQGTLNMYAMFDSQNDQTVNLLFVPKSGSSYLLMKDDAYIRRASYYHESNGRSTLKLSRNIYLVVSQDTNTDGFLSRDDMADLYVSDYNGKNMYVVLKGVEDYQLIQDDLLIIEAGTQSDKTSYTYELLTKELSKLDIKTPLRNR